MRDLISTLKKKAQAGIDLWKYLSPESAFARKKPPQKAQNTNIYLLETIQECFSRKYQNEQMSNN